MTESKLTFKEKVQQFFALEPALLRAVLVALSSVVVQFGVPDINTWVDIIVSLYVALSAVVAFYLAKPHITSMAKVVAFKPRPFDADDDTILPGDAVVANGNQQDELAWAASVRSNEDVAA